MNEKLREMLHKVFSNFGRPDFDLGNDDKIHEADQFIENLERRKDALERRRQRLLEIQSTPRGSMNG